MKPLFSLYEKLILSKPWLSLLLTLAVIGALATQIPNFRLDASSDSLVLEGDQSLKYYREISKRYGSEEFLLVIYQPRDDLLSDKVLANLERLRGELAALEGVSSVVSILDIPLLQSPQVSLQEVAGGDGLRTLRSPDIDKTLVAEELKNSPIYADLLSSADGKTTALQVNLESDPEYRKLLEAREALREQAASGELVEAEQLLAAEQAFRDYAFIASDRRNALVEQTRVVLDTYRSDADVYLGGVPMIAADMISFVKSDLVVFGSGILIFIIVTLTIIFRRAAWVLLPLFTCLLTVSFMLGLITTLDWRMTVISSNFVALLLIITLSITIHLVVRYRELLAKNPAWEQPELARQAAYLMVKPCIYTALTTIVAFASLVISGIRPVIDFGWMMTLGVTAALVIAFIVIPTGMSLLAKPADTGKASQTVEDKPVTLKFAALTDRLGNSILIVALLLALIAAYGISQLKVENRFIDYFDESTEIYRGMEIIDAQLGGTIPLDIIIDADKPSEEPVAEQPVAVIDNDDSFDGVDEEFEEDFDDAFEDEFGDDFSDDFAEEGSATPSYWFNKAGLSRIEQVHDYVDSLDETGKVMSLATSYKLLRNLTSGIDDIQLTLIQRSLPEDINSILVNPYLNEEKDQVRLNIRVMETSHSLQRDELLKTIKQHLVDELGFKDDQVHLTGMLVLYNNMLQSLYTSQILTIGAVFVVIMLMFLVLFKSLTVALIAITPNMLAAGMVLGGMGLAGIPLDIMTVTIAAISVGIAVDNTIHYVHRFKTEIVSDYDYRATMYRCHGSIGKAMLYTSITIVTGFSILALSNFTPSIYFGLLTGIAMLAALIGSLVLLPQLLMVFKPFVRSAG